MEVQLSFAQKIRKKALKLVKIAQFHFFAQLAPVAQNPGKKVSPLKKVSVSRPPMGLNDDQKIFSLTSVNS